MYQEGECKSALSDSLNCINLQRHTREVKQPFAVQNGKALSLSPYSLCLIHTHIIISFLNTTYPFFLPIKTLTQPKHGEVQKTTPNVTHQLFYLLLPISHHTY